MTFKQHIANFVTGNLTTSQLPQVALAGLREGLESKSLTILAGMSENDNPFQLEEYLDRALKELGLERPGKREAALELAMYYADQIIDNAIDPIDGVRNIIEKALGSYDFRSETKEYLMDSIGFAKIYGLYWAYDELVNAEVPTRDEENSEELIGKEKMKIVEEVKKWRGGHLNAPPPKGITT